MTPAMRTIGIPAALFALAACGSPAPDGAAGATTNGSAGASPSGTPTSPPSGSPPGPGSPTPRASSAAASESTPSGLPHPTAPATSPTLGQGPHGPASSPQVFPIIVERRGGIAGFKDTLVLGADGVATFSRRSGAAETCRVDPAVLDQIRAAAQMVRWPAGRQPATTPPGRVSDQMWVTVSSGSHQASLTDPQVGTLANPLTDLLGDISRPADQRTLCRPL